MKVTKVNMFPVGNRWTVIVEYENHAESRNFVGKANAEWYKEIMEGMIQKKDNN